MTEDELAHYSAALPDAPRFINGLPHPRAAVHPPDRRCEDYCATPTQETPR